MSADNCVAVLRTLRASGFGHEYRVAHLQALENVDYDPKTGKDTKDPAVRIRNAREMWGNTCRVFPNLDLAMVQASNVLEDLAVCEYGINEVQIEAVFSEDVAPSDDPKDYEDLITDPAAYLDGVKDGEQGRDPNLLPRATPMRPAYLDGYARGRIGFMARRDHLV